MKTKTYPKKVQKIHSEFLSAADVIYNEAIAIINANNTTKESKINKLKQLGFNSSLEVKEAEDVITKKQEAVERSEIISYYRKEYPIYKFINHNQVLEICNKYRLVLGEISDFTGFVPEKKVDDILNFPELLKADKVRDRSILLSAKLDSNSRLVKLFDEVIVNNIMLDGNEVDEIQRSISIIANNRGIDHNWRDYNINDCEYMTVKGSDSFLICAPSKNMNMEGKDRKGKVIGKVSRFQKMKDPVVLKPVKHGYLIVTAWGDEASDPLVINEIDN